MKREEILAFVVDWISNKDLGKNGLPVTEKTSFVFDTSVDSIEKLTLVDDIEKEIEIREHTEVRITSDEVKNSKTVGQLLDAFMKHL